MQEIQEKQEHLVDNFTSDLWDKTHVTCIKAREKRSPSRLKHAKCSKIESPINMWKKSVPMCVRICLVNKQQCQLSVFMGQSTSWPTINCDKNVDPDKTWIIKSASCLQPCDLNIHALYPQVSTVTLGKTIYTYIYTHIQCLDSIAPTQLYFESEP